MIGIKIFNNKNEFIGYFNFDSILLKKDKKKYIINSFRPLKQEIYVFNEEDLFNGVVKDYIKELTKFFKDNDLYENYSVKVIRFNKQDIIHEYY